MLNSLEETGGMISKQRFLLAVAAKMRAFRAASGSTRYSEIVEKFLLTLETTFSDL